MTLAELIKSRKGNSAIKFVCSELWQGYQIGWEHAYRDLEEILKQNGFDLSVLVMKEGEQK